MVHKIPSLSRRLVAAGVASLVVLSACGGAENSTLHQRNILNEASIVPTKFEKSTVCANFYGAYQKYMTVPNAKVIIRFCPDANRYVMQWGTENAQAFNIVTPGEQIEIMGADFVSRGPVSITIYRDSFDGDSVTGSVLLGSFTLSATENNGKTLLSGTWNLAPAHMFLNNDLRSGPRFLPLYLSYLFDKLDWFQRERCREQVPNSESEAFNLNMSYETLATTLNSWLGTGALAAKNAQAPLAERREMFRALLLIQQNLASVIDETTAFVSDQDCPGKVGPLVKDLTSDQIDALGTSAPLLRDLAHQLDQAMCAGNYTTDAINNGYAKLEAKVASPVDWRFSSEPDKGALESAHLRLMLFHFAGTSTRPYLALYNCGYQYMTESVWTEQQVDAFLHPTTTSLAPDTTAPLVVQKNETTTSTEVVPVTTVISPTRYRTGSSYGLKDLVALAGLAKKTGQTVRVVVLKSSASVCTFKRNFLILQKTGSCAVKISLTKKKKTVVASTLTLQVGN